MAFRPKTDGPAPAKVGGLKAEALLALNVADGVYRSFGIDTWHFTEGTGAKHMKGSKHYLGLAVDVRLPSQYSRQPHVDALLCAALKAALGDEFDVVLEDTHIHIEFDPPNSDKPPDVA